MDASWSLGKVIDLIKHLPAPVIVIGTSSMASTMRIMRGNLLDILGKQYIQTARSKGLKIAVPSDACDAKGMLTSAIRDTCPASIDFMPSGALRK